MISGLEGQSFLPDLLETVLLTLTFFLASASHAAHSLVRSRDRELRLPIFTFLK